jgi:hypothetical protein
LESCSIVSAPKDGSLVPRTLATGLTKASSLAVEEGFVYLATLESQGKIARCPTSGCSGAPDALLDQQYYPHYLTFSNGVLFWLNETDPADKLTAINRPAKLLGCVAASCAETVEVLDEARGGSIIDPIHALSFGPQQMVADAEAVYWIGDVTPLTSGSMVTGIDASIRRLPRKPGK